jgi:hypothetical protein
MDQQNKKAKTTAPKIKALLMIPCAEESLSI